MVGWPQDEATGTCTSPSLQGRLKARHEGTGVRLGEVEELVNDQGGRS